MRVMKMRWMARAEGLAILLAGITLLAACGGTTRPELVPSTPLPTTPEATTSTEPTATIVPTASATSVETLPPPPTLAPATATPVAATATTPATLPPATEPATEPESEARYEVAFVTSDDTLNVRSGPGVDYDVVAELPPQAGGIVVEPEGATLVTGSLWTPIDTDRASGWVNSQFLTQSVSTEIFCSDPAVSDLISTLQQAIEEEDGRLLASLVHPNRDLRIHHDWWNPPVIYNGGSVDTLFDDPTSISWGYEDGSGLPIEGSFTEVMLPRLQEDLSGAQELACDDFLSGATAGLVTLPDGYDPVHFYSVYRPAAEGQIEFEWGAWAVGVELWQGEYYLRYLIHYDYEI